MNFAPGVIIYTCLNYRFLLDASNYTIELRWNI